jgi:hypothetical protein
MYEVVSSMQSLYGTAFGNGDEPVTARVPQPRADSAEQVTGGSILERLGGLLRKIAARCVERGCRNERLRVTGLRDEQYHPKYRPDDIRQLHAHSSAIPGVTWPVAPSPGGATMAGTNDAAMKPG